MIKAVVFDMDGTLVDTEKYLVEYWEKAGKLCGYPMTREDGLFLRSLASEYAVPAMKQRLGEDSHGMQAGSKRGSCPAEGAEYPYSCGDGFGRGKGEESIDGDGSV